MKYNRNFSLVSSTALVTLTVCVYVNFPLSEHVTRSMEGFTKFAFNAAHYSQWISYLVIIYNLRLHCGKLAKLTTRIYALSKTVDKVNCEKYVEWLGLVLIYVLCSGLYWKSPQSLDLELRLIYMHRSSVNVIIITYFDISLVILAHSLEQKVLEVFKFSIQCENMEFYSALKNRYRTLRKPSKVYACLR